MDFKKATDGLMAGLTRGEIAKALDCSEATVRQARLGEAATARRTPPQGWEAKLAQVAEREGNRLLRLSVTLQRQIRA